MLLIVLLEHQQFGGAAHAASATGPCAGFAHDTDELPLILQVPMASDSSMCVVWPAGLGVCFLGLSFWLLPRSKPAYN